eukprot:TRINITY_DN196_c0_g1_i2.p1 TRINITY_DN196_c0_g1~~TRINITY_DN196_c0_g1_i2.p1  ORF type:complete len:675 (+),score=269.59 TRINITY_DN196_c0_g1_i2:42-2027(+)
MAAEADAGVYLAFNKIVHFARDLNTQVQSPEVVFVGRRGHGKTSLIESVLGHPLSFVGEKGATKRPVSINLINNPDYAEPRVVVKRDPVLKDFSSDLVLPLASVEAEVAKRNVISPVPIQINYEYKFCWNITLIDTPGLAAPNDPPGEISAEEIEEMVIEIARPSSRLIVCVEEVKDGNQSEVVSLAKRIDPKFDRTTFVFNKFSDQLKGFTSTRELNRYLTATAISDAHYYFTTLIPGKDRPNYPTKDKFKKRLEELQRDDMTLLEQLQFDKRYAPSVGVVSFRRYLLEQTWNQYQANIPELLKRLRSFKKKSQDSLAHITLQLEGLDSNKLRGNASRYTMTFLRSIEKLLQGTLEGNPAVNGQTTDEEKEEDDAGDWYNSEYVPIKFDATEWKIPYAKSKLYGGQQFERLLSEFKAVADHVTIGKLTADDIATAAGPNKLNNAANCTWAASDIAQRQVRKALMPLLEQLFKRAVFVMKRLVDIVESMMESQRRAKRRTGRSPNSQDELENFPFFTHAVKDLFSKFVDQTAQECKAKCKDEFLSTRLIYWELTNLEGGKGLNLPKSDNKEEFIKAIIKLSHELFNKIRDRVVKNISLKTYNYFFVPMQTELWAEIQGNITCMSDDTLAELFSVQVTRAKLVDAGIFQLESNLNLQLEIPT